MSLLRPSLRRDLAVRPVHRKGQRYIELKDPVTAIRLWLSDLGYSVAFLMDGGTVEHIIRQAREALHIDLSRRRLEKFAERLDGYGLLVGSRPAAARPAAPRPVVAAPAVAEVIGVARPGARVPQETVVDPTAAAITAAGFAPPAAVDTVADGEAADTLTLSPQEMAVLLLDAAARGNQRTECGERRSPLAVAGPADSWPEPVGAAVGRRRTAPVPRRPVLGRPAGYGGAARRETIDQ